MFLGRVLKGRRAQLNDSKHFKCTVYLICHYRSSRKTAELEDKAVAGHSVNIATTRPMGLGLT